MLQLKILSTFYSDFWFFSAWEAQMPFLKFTWFIYCLQLEHCSCMFYDWWGMRIKRLCHCIQYSSQLLLRIALFNSKKISRPESVYAYQKFIETQKFRRQWCHHQLRPQIWIRCLGQIPWFNFESLWFATDDIIQVENVFVKLWCA